jgi:HK97 family phage major capsid protein
MASIAEKYEVKSTELLAILSEGKTENPDVIDLDKITRLSGSKAEKIEEIKKRRTEVEMLGYQVDAFNAQKIAQEAQAHAQNPGGNMDVFAKGEELSAADLYLKSAAYKSEGHGFGATVELKVDAKSWVHGFEQKTIMTTAAGWSVRPPRLDDLTTPIVTRPLQVTDLIPSSNTDTTTIIFMEETTRTNAAIEIGEGVAYPEATSAFTERTSPVRKIGVILPVTDEQLDDVPQVRTFLDDLLPFMVRQRLDQQIFNGNGTPPNLTGLLNVGSIQTQARGADPIPTAFLKAMVKLRVTGRVVPSGLMIHPTDWQSVKTLQTTTGEYVWGHPSVVGPDTMWGLPMAQVDAGSAGTAIVADFRNYTRLYYRNSSNGVEVGYVNDDFKLGQKSLRADVRAAFVVRRAAAICSVTGL